MVRNRAVENIKAAQAVQKIRYDMLHAPQVPFAIGDIVLKENLKDKGRKGGKLNDKFYVQYELKLKLNEALYCFRDPT